jgi:hypothetical protein
LCRFDEMCFLFFQFNNAPQVRSVFYLHYNYKYILWRRKGTILPSGHSQAGRHNKVHLRSSLFSEHVSNGHSKPVHSNKHQNRRRTVDITRENPKWAKKMEIWQILIWYILMKTEAQILTRTKDCSIQ